MLGPVAEALGSALPASMPIYFSMQGEMGATVFRYGRDGGNGIQVCAQPVKERGGRADMGNFESWSACRYVLEQICQV